MGAIVIRSKASALPLRRGAQAWAVHNLRRSRRRHRTGEEESQKPCCRGIAHRGHHPVEERRLPRSAVSEPAPQLAVPRGGSQSHGTLSCRFNLPPAHQRRILGRSRRHAIRRTAQGARACVSKLQSPRSWFQTDSDHRGKLTPNGRRGKSISLREARACSLFTRIQRQCLHPANSQKNRPPTAPIPAPAAEVSGERVNEFGRTARRRRYQIRTKTGPSFCKLLIANSGSPQTLE